MTETASTFDCYSLNGEDYHEGTEADAINEADGPGETYWLGVRTDCVAGDFVDGDDIVDMIRTRAQEVAGDVADDWLFGVSKEALQELEVLVTAWAEKHDTIHFWLASNVEKRLVPHPSGAIGGGDG